jgi:hypothetical protein
VISKRRVTNPDRCFRQSVFVPLLNAITSNYGKNAPFDKELVKRVEKQLTVLLRFASESRSHRRKRGRPSRFPVEAFRRYGAGERGSRFYNEFISDYPQMTPSEQRRARRAFTLARSYFNKKQTREADKAKKLVLA